MTVTRQLKANYGGFDIGDSPYNIHGPVILETSYESFNFRAMIVIEGTSLNNLQSREVALEVAFRKPKQVFTYTIGTTTRTYSEATYTALDMKASARKIESSEFVGLTSLYEVVISFDFPADLTGQDYIQTATTKIVATPSGIRNVSISGLTTANDVDGRTAREQLAQVIETYCNAVLEDIDDTAVFEKTSQTEDYDRYDFKVAFVREYRELITRQGGTTTDLDVPSIVNESLRVSIIEPYDGVAFTSGAEKMFVVSVQYSAFIDKAVTTDLQTVYLTEIRPLLLLRVQSGTSISAVAVIQENPTYDQVTNTIAVSMTCLVSDKVLIEADLVHDSSYTRGVAAIPVWSGDSYTRSLMRVPVNQTQVITCSVVVRGDILQARQNALRIINIQPWERGLVGFRFNPTKLTNLSGPEAGQVPLFASDGGWLEIQRDYIDESTRIVGKNPNTYEISTLVVQIQRIYVVPNIVGSRSTER